ncbi:MAG: HigA family addiction module antidote protein [Treponema sp.]|jgi:addiction module HigA family antidote|nr:HigA family addiction module antidote protein [Treponema sp.]
MSKQPAKKQSALVPGTVLKENFLNEYGLSPAKIAEDLGLSQSIIRQILSNKAKISLRIALHLSKYFGNPVQYWIDLQNTYDLAILEGDAELKESLKKIPKAKKQAPVKKAEKAEPAKKGAAKRTPKAAAAPRKPRTPRKPKTES